MMEHTKYSAGCTGQACSIRLCDNNKTHNLSTIFGIDYLTFYNIKTPTVVDAIH